MSAAALWTVILIFMAGVCFLCWWSGRRTKKNTSGLFLGGRSLPPFVLALTIFATLQSGFSILGFAGLWNLNGPGATISNSICAAQTILVYIVYRRFWVAGKFYNLNSQADYFADRYESPKALRLIVGIIGLCAVIGSHFTAQLTAMGTMVSTISGGAISYDSGMIVLAVVMMIVCLLGGLRGLATADAVMGVGILTGLAVIAIGVLSGAKTTVSQVYKDLGAIGKEIITLPGESGTFTPQMLISWFVTYAFGATMLPHMFTKNYTAASIKNYKSTPLWYLLACFIMFPLILIIIGPLGRLYVDTSVLSTTDQVVPTLITTFVNQNWVIAMLLVAFLCAIVSTGAAALLTLSQILTVDIFKVIFPNKSEKTYFWVGRVGFVLFTAIGLLLVYNPPAALGYMMTANLGMSAMLFFPAVLGLYWKRMNKAGCYAGIIAGAAAFIYFTWIYKGGLLLGFNANFWTVVIGLIAIIIVSLATKPSSEDALNKYYFRINKALHGVAEIDNQ